MTNTATQQGSAPKNKYTGSVLWPDVTKEGGITLALWYACSLVPGTFALVIAYERYFNALPWSGLIFVGLLLLTVFLAARAIDGDVLPHRLNIGLAAAAALLSVANARFAPLVLSLVWVYMAVQGLRGANAHRHFTPAPAVASEPTPWTAPAPRPPAAMNPVVGAKLKVLVTQGGEALLSDRTRFENLLLQQCGQCPREIAALIAALDARVPQRLRNPAEKLTELTFDKYVVRLVDERGLDKDAANWAVVTWASALGLQPPATRRPAGG